MSTCAKRRFRDEISAKLALADIQRRGKDSQRPKDERRAYRCPRCRGWHLTSRSA